MYKFDAPQHGAGGKSGQVADNPAAQRDQCRSAFDSQGQQLINQVFEMVKVLGLLARGQNDLIGCDGGRSEIRNQ